MIDKIVITLADTGFINVNVGDVHFIHTPNTNDVIRNVAGALKHLAYFPSNSECMSKPITFEEFQQSQRKKKVEKSPKSDDIKNIEAGWQNGNVS